MPYTTPLNEIKEKVQKALRHIRNVQDGIETIALKLIDNGYVEQAREILAQGLAHDRSKFSVNSFFKHLVLCEGTPEKIKGSVYEHSRQETHHPECFVWDHISEMDTPSLIEMVCDWKARSQGFGTDLRKWIDEEATVKFEFKKDDEVYKRIMYYVDMLLEKPFKPL